ncbi:MAG: glycosyltransferase family 4 protein [Thermoleophilia bacterium]|nr:glycosyltransferase family 4 protein [Gaiellaceae bacterium]MDW8338583.1 glycosyltransferase family 4 protein [Thermoleophilia bacterium]
MPTRPLFLTRRFPPSIGGMQTLAASTWRALQAATPNSILVAYGGDARGVLWLPRGLARAAWFLATRRADLVLTGDAVMCAAAWPIVSLSRTRSATMVHGLDLSLDNVPYRSLVTRALRGTEIVLANSESTANLARELGVPPERLHVLRLGAEAPDLTIDDRREARARLNEDLGVSSDCTLVLTLGRLVRRKGVAWFVEAVVPRLAEDVVYVVAGEGDEAARIRATAARGGLSDRVRLLGRVDDAMRERLLRGVDLFVQPNVEVPGDVEGFGLVVVEAALRGTPVVAADLQGLAEAVADGETGRLVPAGDADAWVAVLTASLADRASLAERGWAARERARERYSERAMADELVRVLEIER